MRLLPRQVQFYYKYGFFNQADDAPRFGILSETPSISGWIRYRLRRFFAGISAVNHPSVIRVIAFPGTQLAEQLHYIGGTSDQEPYGCGGTESEAQHHISPPQPQPVQWLPAENEMAKRSGDKNGRPEQSPQERREEEQAVETGELVGQT